MALRDWAERNREFVIIFISFVVITILSVAAMKMSGGNEKKKQEEETPTEVESTAANTSQVEKSSGNGGGQQKASSPSYKTVGGYFTEISPETIIAQAQIPSALAPLPPNPEEVQMPVGWFVYFSSTELNDEGKTRVILDTDKDGFGTIIVCQTDLAVYPQFRTMETGKKLWVAGHIQDVSLEGTGTINLVADHFRFDGHTHVALFPDEEG